MAEEIKKMFVRIGGMSYQLVTTENEQYTRQIAAKADEMIHRVMQNNPLLSQNMSTVLALVNAVDELNGLYQRLGSVDGQKAETEKQASEARKELMRLRDQNWEMKKEILRLNEINKYNQALIGKLTTPGDLIGGQADQDDPTPTPASTQAAAATADTSPAPAPAQAAATADTTPAPAPTQAVQRQPATKATPASPQADAGKSSLPEQTLAPDQPATQQQAEPQQPISNHAQQPIQQQPVQQQSVQQQPIQRQPVQPQADQPATSAPSGASQQVGYPAMPLDNRLGVVSDLQSNRTETKSSQADVAKVGELKQTNLDDYLKANGWPQTYEPKKHD